MPMVAVQPVSRPFSAGGNGVVPATRLLGISTVNPPSGSSTLTQPSSLLRRNGTRSRRLPALRSPVVKPSRMASTAMATTEMIPISTKPPRPFFLVWTTRAVVAMPPAGIATVPSMT